MGDPGAKGDQGPGAVALRYSQPAPIAGAVTHDQKLATVGGFEYWGGCNIDASLAVTVSLWVIPTTTGTFAAIGHYSGQFDDTGAFYDGNIHGGGLTGAGPYDVFTVSTAHYLRNMNGPLVVYSPTEMQTVVYSEIADGRPANDGCSIVGTVTPAS